VQAGDTNANGISIGADAIDLNGGRYQPGVKFDVAANVVLNFTPPKNDGKSIYKLNIKDVPVDGF
jgi:hypothetical protein